MRSAGAQDVRYVASQMFKIKHNTVLRFSLAEILLMLAINQLEAQRKVGPSE